MIAGIIGGSGYTGRELIKLLLRHTEIKGIKVYGRNSGKPISSEITELRGLCDFIVEPADPKAILKEVGVLFIALPHKVSMEISPAFQDKVLLIDLSADYRFDDASEYLKWYGEEHKDRNMLGKYTYGMPEIFRNEIKNAKKIANPGCYPTSVILGLIPLFENGLVDGPVIVDSKSGYSGAGKKLTEILSAGNLCDNIQPYKLINHQHIGEMKRILKFVGREKDVKLTFTPYVMPFERGILSAIYVTLKKKISQEELNNIYLSRYSNEPFVRYFKDKDILPTPKSCAYTNFCDISCTLDPEVNRVTIISCIDNLLKGASGQAVQNMNIALGFNEKEGLV